MGKVFNPPPNWPRPPEGWRPPRDWTPDPSWGPAPDGWQFYVDEASRPQPPWAAPKVEPDRPRGRFFRSLLFWGVLVVVGVTVAALATGGRFGAVEISGDGGFRIEFDNSAGGAEGLSPDQVGQAQPELDDRVSALEERAQSSEASNTQAGIDVSGTWQGSNGFTYRFEQYGSSVVFQEEAPGYGITAVGDGVVDGSTVYVGYQAWDGSTGSGQFSAGGGTLQGTVTNALTGITGSLELTRTA